MKAAADTDGRHAHQGGEAPQGHPLAATLDGKNGADDLMVGHGLGGHRHKTSGPCYQRDTLRNMLRCPPEKQEERFWEKVAIADSGCWEWTAGRDAAGYGQFSVTSETRGEPPLCARAHRVAWEIEVGPIPPGMYLDHLCYNPPCVNPEHLELVTPGENVLRARSRRRAMQQGLEIPALWRGNVVTGRSPA